ncbi:NADPH-dependent FMN reductase [Cohnella luojiensis]|uniref:NADPH-dependent FMN reductase n=1 Tax=Cohnella luojiensis TaxID=652876 RepID=A0A4Y8LS35_9BACL|nr:NADPH-dependent FMN reductase [Cohnella luojiensis]TFE23547.1 NADPH-dependent FMN reductase [Cohnella luojiensis]
MSHIVIISGSPTPGSRLNGVIQRVESKWIEQGIKISHIRVSELPAEALLHANFKDEKILDALALVESASGVVIASPVYKASFTGILKAFLDLFPQTGLKGKATLPLFIGGTIAHLLSLDYALKPILSVLGSRNILGGVYAIDQWVQRLDDGGFELSEELKERLDRSAEEMAEEITWIGIRSKEKIVIS